MNLELGGIASHRYSLVRTYVHPGAGANFRCGTRGSSRWVLRTFLTMLFLVVYHQFVWTTAPCLAITGEYGNNFNKLIEMYKAIYRVQHDENLEYIELENYIPLYVDPKLDAPTRTWFQWFHNFFDVSTFPLEVTGGGVLPIFSRCRAKVTAEALFYSETKMNESKYWDMLHPRERYKEKAVAFMQGLRAAHPGRLIVSVHKRGFEGNCGHFVSSFSSKKHPEWYCGMTVNSLEQNILPAYRLDPTNVLVVLVSDGQDPEGDASFNLTYKGSFLSAVWLMTLTDFHIGTNASTIDVVVSNWRGHQGTNVGRELR
mmetsp:Transcript_7130/g.11339  ORF Transcript_7130/g.11339 Transcript_7130/m.11339 type:complete len:314 (+) Transcript_7130:39-980(+)